METPTTLFVKPARPGLLVAIPEKPGQFLPDGGARVLAGGYWYRALRRGDVVHVKEAKKSEAPKRSRTDRDRETENKD